MRKIINIKDKNLQNFLETFQKKNYVRRQHNSYMVFTLPDRILGHKGMYYVCGVLLVVGYASSINNSDDSLYIKRELYVFSAFYAFYTGCICKKLKGNAWRG